MIKPKEHLKNIKRVNTEEFSRKDFLRLDKNENPYGLPKKLVKEILSEITPEMISMYPEYDAVIKKIATLYDRLNTENICVTNGSDTAIKYIFEAYLKPHDKVLVTDPTFAMYPIYAKMYEAEVITVPYNCMEFPSEEFLSKIDKDIKIVVIVNPNNPTGSFIGFPYIEKVIKKAKNSLVIIDEAYYKCYTFTAIKLINKYNNLVVLRTFSKLFSMANLRIGYAIANENIINSIKTVKPSFDVDGISALFAERILDNTPLIVQLANEESEGKDYLAKNLKKEGIDFVYGPNFILIKCENRVNEIIERLKQEHILVHGGFKQNFLKDYIRVTTCNKKYMKMFWESFIRIWKTK